MSKQNKQTTENTVNTVKVDLLELVRLKELAERRKAIDEEIKAQSGSILAEIEKNNAEIEKLHAKNVELRKLMGDAGVSTGRGRPPMSPEEKAKAKAEREAKKNSAQPAENPETAKTLEILKGGVESGPAPVANIETVPAAVAA